MDLHLIWLHYTGLVILALLRRSVLFDNSDAHDFIVSIKALQKRTISLFQRVFKEQVGDYDFYLYILFQFHLAQNSTTQLLKETSACRTHSKYSP